MKNNIIKKALAVILSSAVVITTLPQENLITASAAKKNVSLNTTFKTLKIGKSYKLKLKNNTINWKIKKVTTSNKKICTVYNKKSTTVLLKGKNEGRATIKIKIKTNKRKVYNKKTLKCRVKVIPGKSSQTPIPDQPTVSEPESTYNIEFNTNGGNIISGQTVTGGNTITKPADPTKSGYIFKGWYSDISLQNAYDFTSIVTDNMTLYAKWNNTYKVEFQTNGGNKIEDQIIENGGIVSKPADPTRARSTFIGWFSDSQLKEPYDFSSAVTKDITIYARWEGGYEYPPNLDYSGDNNGTTNDTNDQNSGKYTVIFNTNGGNIIDNQVIDKGDNVKKPKNPIKSGYVFLEWDLDENLTKKYDFSLFVTSNLILHAKWAIDTDNDVLSDAIEKFLETDPDKEDTDGDKLSDHIEVMIGTDPTKIDTDEDGILDGDEDIDKDGISNLKEIEIGTNPTKNDTDHDGLSDSEELTIKTDPLNKDTDGDGAYDGWEVENGYDPLKYNDIFSISNNTSSHNVTASAITTTSGTNSSSLSITPINSNIFLNENIPGYIDVPFDFEINGNISEATISFSFDESLALDGLFNPTIYYFNEKTQLLEEIETIVEGNVASATVSHFSTYILINKTDYDKAWETEIKPPDYTSEFRGLDVVFVLDSSGSMSSNDNNNLRLQAAKNFIDKLGNNDRAAVIDFDSGASLYQEFTSDHELLYNAVDRINASGGTNLSKGISLAISQFVESSYDRNDAYKYIIFLTDGDGSYNTSYTDRANENGIVIYTIGLGDGVNQNILENIAEGTGGKYFFASTADVLNDIYNNVSEETVDYSTDSNADGISDYFTKLLCDGTLKLGSGKTSPFYRLSYEEIQANNDYDNDGLLNGQELIVKFDEVKRRVYVWMMSDPTSSDSDFDGIDDNSEVNQESMHSNQFKANLVQYAGDNRYDININFVVDYSLFFGDNSIYNQNLAILASIFSADMYDGNWIELISGAKGNTKTENGITFGEIFGLKDGKRVTALDLKLNYGGKDSNGNIVDEDDVSEVYFGHKLVSYKNEKREIIFMMVRGTNGTNEEWSSNFDIGASLYSSDNEYNNKTGEHPDWVDKDNHKGFDVAATRIMKAYNEYIQNLEAIGHLDTNAKRSIFISGHSRGAAIANILGAKFEDDIDYDSFVYTLAAPYTTTKSTASSYKTIFNICNNDDLVPFLPLSDWNFKKYGKTLGISVKENYEDHKPFSDEYNTFEAMFHKDYDSNAYLSAAVNSFKKIANTREDFYILDTVSGDGKVSEGIFDSYEDMEKILKKGKMLKYCLLEKGLMLVNITYCPAYVAQNIANLAGNVDGYSQLDWIGIDLKGRYSEARRNFILASGYLPIAGSLTGGMEHPHMPCTYYLITNNTVYEKYKEFKLEK